MEQGLDNKSVLSKLATILDAFGEPPHRYTFTEISERTEVSKASVYRLMAQLVEVGFLERDGAGKTYGLGRRLTRLLHFNLRKDVLDAVFGPELQNVADRVAEACFAARLSGNDVEIFAVQGPSGRNSSYLHPGLGVRPLHACPSAKCILAYQSAESVTRLLEANLPSIAAPSTVDPQAIAKELEKVRRLGFAECDEEIEEAVYSIACPVFLEETGVIYSVGVMALKTRVSPDRIDAIREELTKASARISELLGTQGLGGQPGTD